MGGGPEWAHRPAFADPTLLDPTFDRKADAIRWAKQHETAVQTGRYLLSPEASKRTLADLIDRYTEQVLPDLPTSARDYARVLLPIRHLPPAD